MKIEKRKYAQGGYVLPVVIATTMKGKVHVKDSTGRLVKEFNSVAMATALTTKLNNL